MEGTLKGMPIGLDLPRLVMGWFFDDSSRRFCAKKVQMLPDMQMTKTPELQNRMNPSKTVHHLRRFKGSDFNVESCRTACDALADSIAQGAVE